MTNMNSTDAELEDRFIRHGDAVDDLPPGVFTAIAPWIPIIGVPANDRSTRCR